MTYQIEFELDEFKPWPTLSVYVYGMATLSYEYEPDDPDVGYRGGITYPTLESLTIYGDSTKDDSQVITDDHPLWHPISVILERTDYAVDACADHYEGCKAYDYEN